jgi:hypothetical protein
MVGVNFRLSGNAVMSDSVSVSSELSSLRYDHSDQKASIFNSDITRMCVESYLQKGEFDDFGYLH